MWLVSVVFAKALKASDLEKSSQLERISRSLVEFSEMKKGGHSWVGWVWHGNWGMNFGYPPWNLTARPSNYYIDDFPIPAEVCSKPWSWSLTDFDFRRECQPPLYDFLNFQVFRCFQDDVSILQKIKMLKPPWLHILHYRPPAMVKCQESMLTWRLADLWTGRDWQWDTCRL